MCSFMTLKPDDRWTMHLCHSFSFFFSFSFLSFLIELLHENKKSKKNEKTSIFLPATLFGFIKSFWNEVSIKNKSTYNVENNIFWGTIKMEERDSFPKMISISIIIFIIDQFLHETLLHLMWLHLVSSVQFYVK